MGRERLVLQEEVGSEGKCECDTGLSVARLGSLWLV